MLTDKNITVQFVTHNGARAVKMAIESLKKTEPTVPFTVINNGCHSKHLSMMAGMQIPQETFKENLPLATVWNRAILMAETPYVCISNDDVLFETGWLTKAAEALSTGEAMQVNMGYPNSSYSCFIVSRKLIVELGWFDPRFKTYCWEDEDWHLRLSEYAKSHNVPYPVAFVRGVRADRNLRKADHQAWGKDFYSTKPNEEVFHRKWKKVPMTEEGLDPKHHKLKGKVKYQRVLPEIDPYPEAREHYRKWC